MKLSDDPRWRFAHVCENCGEKIVERGVPGGAWRWFHLDSNRCECRPPLMATPKKGVQDG